MTSHGSTGMYSSALAMTDNLWLEQVTTDIPFLAVGIVALACVTCLLLTQRLSIPAACILTSAFFAFTGAIFDFARLLQVSKDTTNANIANSGPFAIAILREISFALSIALNYLFFLIYLGRPPRGETKLVDPAERGRARRESPSRWAYWGWFGYLLQALLIGAIVAVVVLEVLWRVTPKPEGPVYIADGIIEGVITLSFIGKIILNTWLSPLTPRWKTLRDYSPLTFALSIRLGIIITEQFCTAFSEAPLGRLLQGIQFYVLIVLVLVSPYWELREKDDEFEQPEPKRASSFRGLRFSTISQLSALNIAPEMYSQGTQNSRGSPSQRLSSWINSRLATRKDPSQDRLWIQDNKDLEAPPTPREQNVDENEGSPMDPRFADKQPTATWQGPYVPNPTSPEATSNPTTPNTPGQIISITANLAPVPNLSAPKSPSQRNSKLSGQFMGKFEISENYESDSDSPVYGINGIIQKKGQRSEKKRRSKYDLKRLSAIEQLKKEREELEKSVASMLAFSPSKSEFGRKSTSNEDGDSRPDFTSATIPSQLTGGGLSESVRSEFSLGDFPSPPTSIFTSAKPNDGAPPVPVPERPPTVSAIKGPNKGGLETVDDVQFAMVSPRMPAGYSYSRRRASFPTVARESATSSADGFPRIISAYADSEDDIGRRVRISDANNNRLDVTSFIGELTTPQPSKGFGQGRTDSRSRIDSAAALRLSPLPESDNSRRSSVEIIDMQATPVAPVIAQRIPKVSFAPATYDPTGRPKINKPNPALLNTLPATPRPSGSPVGSPRNASQFKPATPSPLAGGSDSSRRGLERNGTPPDFSDGSRPFISAPMSLKPTETDYQASRRAPNPVRTRRFL